MYSIKLMIIGHVIKKYGFFSKLILLYKCKDIGFENKKVL